MEFVFKPIGIVRSCFTEKFGTPRQPGLVPEAGAEIVLSPPYHVEEAVRGLSSFSHLWIVFVFHRNRSWSPTVRPPRLGGNRRIGVFASRSGFRPNPVGMSAVRLEKIVRESGSCRLRISGGDLIDGTPVLDVKPYVPYADRICNAEGGFAGAPPERRLEVVFSSEAEKAAAEIEAEGSTRIKDLISAVIALDPRPAYQRTDSKRDYGTLLHGFDVRWQVCGKTALVTSIGEPCVPDIRG